MCGPNELAHNLSDEVNREGQVVRFRWLRALDLNQRPSHRILQEFLGLHALVTSVSHLLPACPGAFQRAPHGRKEWKEAAKKAAAEAGGSRPPSAPRSRDASNRRGSDEV